ncbi:IMP cyclohydrolase [Paenarthrobacter nicotinovorans]|uniref:IMP cyclohydrolase n=1 Tax=Paenarthrobacter nicotinovorans TaxID=29320 RepID=UPI003D665F4E
MPNALPLITACAQRPYPGRGIVLGRDRDGIAFGLYWLTGRSYASQQRAIQSFESEIVVRDLTDGPQDELRHYTAAIRDSSSVMIGNGTHVGSLWHEVSSGITFDDAHQKIDYEPDPPIYTPRITAKAALTGAGVRGFVTSAAVSDPDWPGITQHKTVHIQNPDVGQAQFVTTYTGDPSNPAPSGVAKIVKVESSWSSLTEDVWNALDPNFRVSITTFPLEGPTFFSAITLNKNA